MRNIFMVIKTDRAKGRQNMNVPSNKIQPCRKTVEPNPPSKHVDFGRDTLNPSSKELLTRLNLSLRGIDIPSIICPNCGLAGESCSHLFYSCNLARTLWRKIARWWEIDIPDFSCYEEWIAWFKTTRFSKTQKEMLEGVFYVMWWMIWKFRNQVLFGSSHPRMELLFDDIVSYSFTWCSNRCKNNIDWISWMKCPKSTSL
ncbi:RNA-directed DNA polymerase, eukaryota [Tanacetum coccineum]